MRDWVFIVFIGEGGSKSVCVQQTRSTGKHPVRVVPTVQSSTVQYVVALYESQQLFRHEKLWRQKNPQQPTKPFRFSLPSQNSFDFALIRLITFLRITNTTKQTKAKTRRQATS